MDVDISQSITVPTTVYAVAATAALKCKVFVHTWKSVRCTHESLYVSLQTRGKQ